jgi:hypothetical protein
MEKVCQCNRTERVASVDGVDYVRCLDCRRIFEAEDLDPVPVYDDEEPTNR